MHSPARRPATLPRHHCLLALGLAAIVAAQDPTPVFHCTFDGTPNAAIAAGQATPLIATGLTYQAGVSGQAAVLSGTRLRYAATSNLPKAAGTMAFWFKPDWAPQGQLDSHTFFAEQGSGTQGSGSLWVWGWGALLRGDMRDADESYTTTPFTGLCRGSWAHLAFSWHTSQGSVLYINGVPCRRYDDNDSPLNLGSTPKTYNALLNTHSFFTLGSEDGGGAAGGLIDEFRIYGTVLTAEQVRADMARVSRLRLDGLTHTIRAGAATTLRLRLGNIAATAFSGTAAWELRSDTADSVLASGTWAGLSLAPAATAVREAGIPALAAGGYRLLVQATGCPLIASELTVLATGNAMVSGTQNLDTTLVERIAVGDGVPAARLATKGACVTRQLAGRNYYESGAAKFSRFAVRATLPAAGVPYVIEWEIPDDKVRTMELVVQSASDPGKAYEMQTGSFCGNEFPNTGAFLTQRTVYWASSTQIALIFMTMRDNAPAAVADVRISRLNGGLPAAQVTSPTAEGGWRRTVGLFYEDPAMNWDFGVAEGETMPGYGTVLDRLAAYMRWSGQDLLSYPAVWYQGRIGESYQARTHEADYIGKLAVRLGANGLGVMASFNLQNIPMPAGVTVNATTANDGSLHPTAVMIHRTGRPNISGEWNGEPPNFNPLHADVQSYVDAQVDDLLDRYGAEPGFRGIAFNLYQHNSMWFGDLTAGYNDYNIAAFRSDTGINVPVYTRALRGVDYYNWLMANQREAWTAWRCSRLAAWYKAIAARLAARRSDLRLALYSFIEPPWAGAMGADFTRDANRAGGLDAALFANEPNIIVAQTIFPADYRWQPASANPRDYHLRAETYAPIGQVALPWVGMHDRYFEERVTDPLDPAKLTEIDTHVSALAPNREYALQHFVMPLRFGDVIGYTKGGFLVGTLGIEDKVREFATAFRALPAVRFADVPGSTATMKVRSHADAAGLWIYAVNTEHTTTSVDIPLAGLVDLATGATLADAAGTTTVALGPYQLRALRAASGSTLSGVNGVSTLAPLTITTTAIQPTRTSPIHVVFTFPGGTPAGFAAEDVTVTGGSRGVLTGSDPFAMDITPAGTGTVTVSVAMGACTVAALPNAPASLAIAYDVTAPVIVANSTPSRPQPGQSVRVDLSASETLIGPAQSDAQVTGASVTAFTGSGQAYVLTLTAGPDGTLDLLLPAGACTDQAGNPSPQVLLHLDGATVPPTPALSVSQLEPGGCGGGAALVLFLPLLLHARRRGG